MDKIDFSNPDIQILIMEYSKTIDKICNLYETELEKLRSENIKLKSGTNYYGNKVMKTFCWSCLLQMKRIFNYLGILEILQGMELYKRLKKSVHNFVGDCQ